MIENYEPNAGQTYIPAEESCYGTVPDYIPLKTPDPELPITLELLPEFRERGFTCGETWRQEFLPGVTAEMLDWFWANMEKCYYLWAPGAHKSFRWLKAPWKYGFLNSAHEIVEPKGPVMMRIQISRLDPAEWYPFGESLEHLICEGIYNSKGELNDATIHMWQDVPGGCVHICTTMENTRISELPDCIKRLVEKLEQVAAQGGPDEKPPVPQPGPDGKVNGLVDHSGFESSRWPEFLPTLFKLWEGHPDPTQNVQCNLTVRKNEQGRFAYVAENPPVAE